MTNRALVGAKQMTKTTSVQVKLFQWEKKAPQELLSSFISRQNIILAEGTDLIGAQPAVYPIPSQRALGKARPKAADFSVTQNAQILCKN